MRLKSGAGWLAFSCDADLFSLSDEDRAFLDGIIRQLDAYEAAEPGAAENKLSPSVIDIADSGPEGNGGR